MPRTIISRKDFLKMTGVTAGVGALSYLLGLRSRPAPVAAMDDLPGYVDASPGSPVFRGPFRQKDVKLAAFQFPVDVTALTSFCNQTLNAAHAAPFEYLPVLSSMVVVYADLLNVLQDEEDTPLGLIPETELGFWVLMVAMQKTRLGKVPHHMAWYIPYLFVDGSSAISTGREVYGFNKQAAVFEKPQDLQSPRITAHVMALQHFAPDAVAKQERLIDLLPVNPEAAPEAASTAQWTDEQSAKKNLWEQLLTRTRTDLGAEIVEFSAHAALNNVPLVFLKQMRHATQMRKAAYQTVVEAPLRIQTFHSGGFFKQPHVMTLYPLDSHPLASQLGLGGAQFSENGAWARLDFVLGEGVEY